jgi:hypothetical protein
MCTIGNTFLFLPATKKDNGLFPVLKQFLKKISNSAPSGKSSILKIPVWKLNESPSFPAGKFIQLVSLFKWHREFKSG